MHNTDIEVQPRYISANSFSFQFRSSPEIGEGTQKKELSHRQYSLKPL